ncbi:conserved hypothetical protein [Talaromyces stipitatus ATCC 10500]|uniref:Dienelactone hydrolase domain-containing protein n=2 Tax=Talaromyces stipitatus TaxID=28564 RepID=B8MFY8_TALSN|nr:uncharacterized protein TSTA_009750 [Talaromyces stipitatus ATCC 10500]AWS21692.1 putative dienelactone hydrolase [Talaromyces stipitatus]EED15855.1 conserved hypothetical protein [Talaromyces stipitatus ATCC 10500]
MASETPKDVFMAFIRESYNPCGSEETIGGLKTYVTGRRDATVGVVDVYDVFGISNHTQQGADLVASVPDLLKGTYAKPEWFPLNSDEKRAQFFGLLKGYAAPHKFVDPSLEFMRHVRSRFPIVTKWGSFGLCWGGKGETYPYSFTPNDPRSDPVDVFSMLDPAEAKKITIFHLVMASKDEPSEAVADFKTVIEENGIGRYLPTYTTMHHSWPGLKANLVEEGTFVGYRQG